MVSDRRRFPRLFFFFFFFLGGGGGIVVAMLLKTLRGGGGVNPNYRAVGKGLLRTIFCGMLF